MSDLDEQIRDGLVAATRDIEPPDPDELAERLRARATRSGSDPAPTKHIRPLLAVAAALVLVAGVAGIGLAVSGTDGTQEMVTDGVGVAPPSSAVTTSEATTTTSDAGTVTTVQSPCTMDGLTDMRPALVEVIRADAAPGIGGMPDSESLCARHWTDPNNPARHITQQPGGSPFAIADERRVGRLRWGPIHEGYGMEFYELESDPSPRWSAIAYGMTEAQFSEVVDRMADQVEG